MAEELEDQFTPVLMDLNRMVFCVTHIVEMATLVMVLFAGKTVHQTLVTMEHIVESHHHTVEELAKSRNVTTVKSMVDCGTLFVAMAITMLAVVCAPQIVNME